jgi:hypothetical protein
MKGGKWARLKGFPTPLASMLTRAAYSNCPWATTTTTCQLKLCSLFSTRSTRSTTTKKSSRVTRTTKNVHELPISLLKDGLPVAPLPEYKGGLELDSPQVKVSKRAPRSTRDANALLSVSSSQPSKSTRRRNSKAALVSSTDTPQSGHYFSSLSIHFVIKPWLDPSSDHVSPEYGQEDLSHLCKL